VFVKKQLFILAGILSVVFASQPLSLAQARNSITGFVFTQSRQPLSDMPVELIGSMGLTVSRTRTNETGFYHFSNIGDGEFAVVVKPIAGNYVGEEKRASLYSGTPPGLAGSAAEQVDFYLKLRSSVARPLKQPGVIFAQEVPPTAKKLYQEADVLIASGKEQEGFKKLISAIESFHEYYDALNKLGTAYVFRGMYRPGEVLLLQAVKVNSRSFPAWFGLGVAQYKLNALKDAEKSFERSVEIDRESVNANLWYGITLMAAGKIADAEKALDNANRLAGSKSPEVHWQLARLYKDQGKYNKAADELETVLEQKPASDKTEEIRSTIKMLREKANANSRNLQP
jgi:tetratricopeptide (TPR) repeat protein